MAQPTTAVLEPTAATGTRQPVRLDPRSPEARRAQLVQALLHADVEFVIVGDLAKQLKGAERRQALAPSKLDNGSTTTHRRRMRQAEVEQSNSRHVQLDASGREVQEAADRQVREQQEGAVRRAEEAKQVLAEQEDRQATLEQQARPRTVREAVQRAEQEVVMEAQRSQQAERADTQVEEQESRDQLDRHQKAEEQDAARKLDDVIATQASNDDNNIRETLEGQEEQANYEAQERERAQRLEESANTKPLDKELSVVCALVSPKDEQAIVDAITKLDPRQVSTNTRALQQLAADGVAVFQAPSVQVVVLTHLPDGTTLADLHHQARVEEALMETALGGLPVTVSPSAEMSQHDMAVITAALDTNAQQVALTSTNQPQLNNSLGQTL